MAHDASMLVHGDGAWCMVMVHGDDDDGMVHMVDSGSLPAG